MGRGGGENFASHRGGQELSYNIDMEENPPKKLEDVIRITKKNSFPLTGPIRQFTAPKKRRSYKAAFLILFSLGIILTLISISAFQKWKEQTIVKGKSIYEHVREGAEAIQNLDTQKAEKSFSFAAKEIGRLAQDMKRLGLDRALLAFGKFFPTLKSVPAAVEDFVSFTSRTLSFSEKLNDLHTNAFKMIFNKEGLKLIALVEGLDNDLSEILPLFGKLKSTARTFGLELPEDYLALSVRLRKNASLLKSFLSYFKANSAQHVALLFQNPSEIRPAGGFIGSYADIAIQDGSITQIDVRDIYDPDGQLDIKVIPPRPLQSITKIWGARDANWFFDFPTSAEKVLSFLDQSKIYSERGVKFSSALAINVKVIEDILEIIGPIELLDYKTVIDKDSFLEIVQKEVESGEDKKKGEPKKILKVLTPIILERLADLDKGQKKQVVQILTKRTAGKDVMVYSRDRTMQAYIQNERLGGEVYDLRSGGNDYLAVVHANIAGGKTDAFIKEIIKLDSSIDTEGRVTDNLIIYRRHTGENKKEWWYKTPNKDFFQIMTPPGAKLMSASGHDKKIPDAPVTPANYQKDGDVWSIEKTFEWLKDLKMWQYSQFQKSTFANWLTVKAGEEEKMMFEYALPEKVLITNGANYEFVFEKQSGVEAHFIYTVSAPPGYIWKESQSNIYEFQTEHPDGRIILDLTMEKL